MSTIVNPSLESFFAQILLALTLGTTFLKLPLPDNREQENIFQKIDNMKLCAETLKLALGIFIYNPSSL